MQTTLQFINSTGRHIFLTGKAGTGKTTFLRSLSLRTHKQFAIVAPTGIAALNAGGTTIHSQFLLPFGMFIPDRNYAEPPTEGANWYTESVLARRHPVNSIRKQVLRSIDLLVIDEVSMLRADLLDAIDYRLRSVRNNFRQAFGGVQLLLIGDLYQLPPVVKREENSRLSQYYQSPWFFESFALRQDGFAYIELDKIFRQRDNEFIRVLNNLRVNRPEPEDLDVLNQYYRTPEQIRKMEEVITLTTHNYRADEMNTKALASLPSSSHFFSAKVDKEFPENMFPVSYRLELKVGAQIMFTRNDSEGAYFNGKLATVTAIGGTEVTVKLSGSDKLYQLKREAWDNKRYEVNPETKELEEQVVGTFEQYPVRLAWAITVHKSQGLTFDRAIIDVGQAFADGQVYVALSRLRSIDGLILRTKVDYRVVSADKQIVSFDQENNRPDELHTQYKSQQREFLIKQIQKVFDFDPMLREMTKVVRDGNDSDQFDEITMKPVLQQIIDVLTAEIGNTVRFREQLRTMIETSNDDEFIGRISKGRDYYKVKIWEQVKILARHIAEMKQHKRVKTYLADLDDIDQLLSKKLEEVDKIFHLAGNIIRGHDEFDFSKLKTERDEYRSVLMKEVQDLIPQPKPKKPRKKRTKSK